MTVNELRQSIASAIAATGFNSIKSPGAFWAWLEGSWMSSISRMTTTFPSSGALSYQTQRPAYTTAQGPMVMPGKAMKMRQKMNSGPQKCDPGLRVSGLGDAARACYSQQGPGRNWDALQGEMGRPSTNAWRVRTYLETGKSQFTPSQCSAACTSYAGSNGETCDMAVWAAGESIFLGQYTDQVLQTMIFHSWPYFSPSYKAPAYYPDWKMPCFFR